MLWAPLQVIIQDGWGRADPSFKAGIHTDLGCPSSVVCVATSQVVGYLWVIGYHWYQIQPRRAAPASLKENSTFHLLYALCRRGQTKTDS